MNNSEWTSLAEMTYLRAVYESGMVVTIENVLILGSAMRK